MKNIIDGEKISYWFFRLNGCLTIVNFVIHHTSRPREFYRDDRGEIKPCGQLPFFPL